MSVLLASLLLVTAALPISGPPVFAATGVSVVADPGCPVTIEQVRMEHTAAGLVLVYSIRNNVKDRVSGIVLTAAAVDGTGAIEHIQMVPIVGSIAAGATATQQVTFTRAGLADAGRIVVGVQAVQWKGRRAEWRGALKLSAPVSLARH